MSGWTGIDLDGTLAFYEAGNYRPGVIGEPLPRMLRLVKNLLARGAEVRVFTARAYPINVCVPATFTDAAVLKLEERLLGTVSSTAETKKLKGAFVNVRAIRSYCEEHFGVALAVTNVKDPSMTKLYDDRAVAVVYNTGELA